MRSILIIILVLVTSQLPTPQQEQHITYEAQHAHELDAAKGYLSQLDDRLGTHTTPRPQENTLAQQGKRSVVVQPAKQLPADNNLIRAEKRTLAAKIAVAFVRAGQSTDIYGRHYHWKAEDVAQYSYDIVEELYKHYPD